MVWIWEWFRQSLGKRWFLWTLFVVNLLGTIYGFIWYGNQLAETPVYLRPFVPDSPTGSGLFTLVLLTYLLGRHIPVLEALAGITNFKYGVWAVCIILAGWIMGNEVRWTDIMLIVSHAGMAIESVLYARFFKLSILPVGIAALWTLNNDFLDYVMNIHPWLPAVLDPYSGIVGLFTVLLSLISIGVIWFTNQMFTRNKV
ncbi:MULTISPECIES: DUF1405 domain-containing protein [Brevibacillus]|uniref:DUF1405 domain-containing protein n=1 Tax=Brevibacillus invocatus TaxID=173959 RepID=A0A3M8CHU7_9BACL|nr:MULTISPECIES: DUF1405 domain-containing protein [Brevibacillus]MCM3077870.1 DUF1405 domain-containing protein [Brevibacillus invocatus]MCM3428056.1 DUF1405 domain-containing protein [Brevibacillus invocatus]MDH4616041.1 DUF1405 domain-containing protein [Brevibacillus sp. AY1]RNB75324.1 DUF1405 domain-containing protein [Brevibacillus invocatus]